jgi:hypothetical protein
MRGFVVLAKEPTNYFTTGPVPCGRLVRGFLIFVELPKWDERSATEAKIGASRDLWETFIWATDSAMSLQTYHFLHLIGLIFVFIGFGGLLSSEGAKKAMMWHGIGLVISLVSGFGMLAKMGIMGAMPPWVWIKIALWLVLGFLPVLAKRRVLAAPLVVLIAAVIGGVLGYIGYFKPVF